MIFKREPSEPNADQAKSVGVKKGEKGYDPDRKLSETDFIVCLLKTETNSTVDKQNQKEQKQKKQLLQVVLFGLFKFRTFEPTRASRVSLS